MEAGNGPRDETVIEYGSSIRNNYIDEQQAYILGPLAYVTTTNW